MSKSKTKNRGSMPFLPANIVNLPKNIPPFVKSGYLLDPWWGIEEKIDKMNESIKFKRLEVKERKGKKIKYKKTSHWEYEVTATDRPLGTIEQDINGKWAIKPSFEYEEDLYSQINLRTEYSDFSEAGRALVDFWINT